MIDRILNLSIFIVTLILMIRFFRKDGKWTAEKAGTIFRYFTVLSNCFCALAALGVAIVPGQPVLWMMKYLGTVAVTVTMLTVFLFLAPAYGTLLGLLKGYDLFMHLLTPLAAILTLCVFERRPVSVPAALSAVLPVIVYGFWYLYHITIAPEEKRWEDFYRFNQNGKWPVAYVAMTAATSLLCLAYWGILQIPG